MASHEGKPIRVALLGCGTVGTEVVRLLIDQAADLTARVGAPVELAAAAVPVPSIASLVEAVAENEQIKTDVFTALDTVVKDGRVAWRA